MDEATVKDTLTPVEPAIPVEEEKPATAAPTTIEVADKEAEELGKLLLENGVTKERVNDLLQAPKALESLKYTLQNDPREFFRMLERTDPKTAEKMLEDQATLYVERYGNKGTTAKDNESDLDARLRILQEKVDRAESMEQQRAQQAALASTRQRFDARVEDMLGQLPKDLDLTKTETRAMRAMLETELSRDPAAVQRISNGNFVDVPRAFQRIITEWSTDRKTHAETVKAERERASRGAFTDFQSGPGVNIDIPKGTDASWEATEEGFAAALDRFK